MYFLIKTRGSLNKGASKDVVLVSWYGSKFILHINTCGAWKITFYLIGQEVFYGGIWGDA